jgi:hypothetical protein
MVVGYSSLCRLQLYPLGVSSKNPNFSLAPIQKLVLRAFIVFTRVSRVLLAFPERLLANFIFGIVVSSTWVRLQHSGDCCDAPPYGSMKLFGQPWHEHVSTDPSFCYSRLVLPFSYDPVAASVYGIRVEFGRFDLYLSITSDSWFWGLGSCLYSPVG